MPQLFARIQSMFSALSTRQIVTLGVAFLAVVGVTITSAYWLNKPSYDVLFSDLDAESAAAVVQRLKTAKVDYVLEDGGRTVKAPASRIDELRLDIAAQGMPGSGRVGFEIFDRSSFGVTDFMERVNYQRALEGELGRTISSIGEVASARVHLVIPQKSLFVDQERPATASVVLKLKQNRALAPSTVNAVTSLVAASVESLRPESVVVIDNFGRPLTRRQGDAETPGDGGQDDRERGLEQDMAGRLVALLEPVVGAGRVHVNVSARLSGDSQEETEERWDPTTVVRSRQTTTQTSSSIGPARGPAGARANLPPSATAAAAAAAAPPVVAQPATNSAETINYEVSKLTRHRIQPKGQIARLSVAVVLDDVRASSGARPGGAQPRTSQEMQKIHDLVSAAVGLDQTRGDQLTIENIGFEEVVQEEPPPVPVWVRYQPQAFEGARIVGIVVLALIALLGVVRPMVRASAGSAPALARVGTGGAIEPRTVQDLESEIDAELMAIGGSSPRRLPVLARRAAALTEKEPENTARLLKAWLAENER